MSAKRVTVHNILLAEMSGSLGAGGVDATRQHVLHWCHNQGTTYERPRQ